MLMEVHYINGIKTLRELYCSVTFHSQNSIMLPGFHYRIMLCCWKSDMLQNSITLMDSVMLPDLNTGNMSAKQGINK